MVRPKRLGHATLTTADLEKAIAYYTEVNGLVLAAREKDRVFLATKIGQLALELERGGEAHCTRLSFEVASNSDFAAMGMELAKENIASEQKSDSVPGIAKVMSFVDPKGTTIELFSQWSYVGNRNHQQAVGDGPLKFGHIAFSVPDPKPMADFYQRVLGFRVSDWIENFFVFLRCNADHHTVNFITGKTARMHHFAFEMKDMSHLQDACEVLSKHQIPILWGPVRVGPGHNVCVFFRNHDDQVVEFYIELDQMKDEDSGYFEPRPWHRDQPQRPKVWKGGHASSIWGLPPVPEFFRGRQ